MFFILVFKTVFKSVVFVFDLVNNNNPVNTLLYVFITYLYIIYNYTFTMS